MIHRAGVDHPGLDPYRRVGDAAWLASHRLFVAEGRFVVERLLASAEYTLESILVTPAAYQALSSRLEAAPCDVYLSDRTVVEKVTGFDFHRGCLALARRPPGRSLEALPGVRRLLALERVGNPDNVGGLFRTAAALSAGGVLLDGASGDPFYRKAIRTSMAATLRLPWVRLDPWLPGLDRLRASGFRLVALTPDRSAMRLVDFSSQVSGEDRLVLMLGAEGSGLSEATLQRADVRVRIPIDPELDSLNVVVAAGIALDRLR